MKLLGFVSCFFLFSPCLPHGMCGFAGAGISPVKASLLIFFYAHWFSLFLHWVFHIIISYFLVKDRNSLC